MSTNNLSSPASGRFSLSAAALHILAMVLMLMDHLWATLLPAQDWLTCAGRLAFPIFAFMAVEGYFHTHSFRKYALRLALFAVLSEVPFDLMYGGTWFYPVHQNVIWTLLLGLLGIHLMETVRKKQKTWLYLLTALLAGGRENICVVGDDDQSIYRFRGATIENILDFEKQYPRCRTIRLEQNYRSTQSILNAANAVISHNIGRKGKKLWTDNGDGDLITVYEAADEGVEANFVAGQILAGTRGSGPV